MYIDPWTNTPHYFTIYDQPSIINAWPMETKTSKVVDVSIMSNEESPFSIRKYI